jgi:hypothetical protein
MALKRGPRVYKHDGICNNILGNGRKCTNKITFYSHNKYVCGHHSDKNNHRELAERMLPKQTKSSSGTTKQTKTSSGTTKQTKTSSGTTKQTKQTNRPVIVNNTDGTVTISTKVFKKLVSVYKTQH